MVTLGLLAALLVSAEPPAARLVIDFAPPQNAPAWYSHALEQLVSREVSRFHRLVTEGPQSLPPEELGKLAALSGVSEFPTRVKCAILAWHALRSALSNGKVVSTE
jgi:hypothetical protein